MDSCIVDRQMLPGLLEILGYIISSKYIDQWQQIVHVSICNI